MIPADLRPHQRHALRLLARNGSLPVAVLARAVGHSPREAAEFARRLAARGLVELSGGSWGHTALARLSGRGIRAVALSLALPPASCCGAADAHDWYSGLRSPAGTPCCSDTMRECHPTKDCALPDGKQGVLTNGWGCVPVPPRALLDMPSPDGETHVCESPVRGPTPVLYCVIKGASA